MTTIQKAIIIPRKGPNLQASSNKLPQQPGTFPSSSSPNWSIEIVDLGFSNCLRTFGINYENSRHCAFPQLRPLFLQIRQKYLRVDGN